MQLPSIDRTQNVRPSGVDSASSSGNRVIPVAPVNPAVRAHPVLEPSSPGVIDKVDPALKAQSAAEKPYVTVSDPATRGSEAATVSRDWTIHRPQVEKAEVPPPKPISQVLLDHLKTVWTASASAIQVEQVKNQVTPPPQVAPKDVPGELAKQILTYQPSKIKKTENI
jgi:hypothetical protein